MTDDRQLELPNTAAVEPYPAWAKTPRLNDYARQMLITEKIDGTNGLIEIRDTGEIRAGSRSRWLESGKHDNFGFAGWVETHKAELLKLGPGRHYGEWWGAGIQRTYGLKEKRFSLFRWWRPDRPPEVPGLDVAPILYQGLIGLDRIETALEDLARAGSYAAPGYNRPEGLVVWINSQRWKVVVDK
jgi:hypothetical protein